MSRRGFLGGAASALLAGVGGRALAGCSSPDVSVRIRRIDGTVQGSFAEVRASVVLTNHTQVAQMVPLHMTLTVGGAVRGTHDDTVPVAAAEIICWCIPVLVDYTGPMSDATVTITVADETASAAVSTLGSDPLRSCDYTCNY